MTDDVRDDMLAETDGRGYGVVVVNSVSFPLYRRRDWLLPISEAEVPHLAHIDPRWKNALPAATGYGAPYAWGTTGIAYRTDLVPEPISVLVDSEGTGRIPDERLCEVVRKVFPLTPSGIIKYLDLRRPIYRKTASGGHFGRNDPDFTWEKTDRAAELAAAAK